MIEDQSEPFSAVVEAAKTPIQRPRIALMGEFSAGKSTLANVLLQRSASPVQATATQLPPVWYRLGSSDCERIRMDGTAEPVPAERWQQSCAQDTQMVFLEQQAEFLQSADLIDMPGTSDPNLAVQYWETVLPQVDIVIWCTPANQAWRQSEAAIWADVEPSLQARSLLLVTRIDQIRADVDVTRILDRVKHEAGAQFGEVLPISLTHAQAAASDDDAFQSSGATDMMRFLTNEIEALDDRPRPPFKPIALNADALAAGAAPTQTRPVPRRVLPKRLRRPERPAEA